MARTGKQGHSRSYPRGVGLDFRKLAGLTLLSYIDHHVSNCSTVLFTHSTQLTLAAPTTRLALTYSSY